jgi:hypothetical protein
MEGLGPGMVEDEFPPGVVFQVERHAGDESLSLP